MVFHSSGRFCLDVLLPPSLSVVPQRATRSTEGPACGHDGDGDCDVEMVWGGIQGGHDGVFGKEKSHPLFLEKGTVACITGPVLQFSFNAICSLKLFCVTHALSHGQHQLASCDSPFHFASQHRGVIKSPSSRARLPGFEPLFHNTVSIVYQVLIHKKGCYYD